MNHSKRIFFAGMIAGLVILTVLAAWAQPKQTIRGPVITNFYALDKGRYGTNWKIYIEAEDSDAEMTKVAAIVDQAGQGHYPTDFVILDPQYRNHLKGFLQWNTFSSRGLPLKEGARIILRISIIDRAGHESKEVLLPFTFVSGVRGQPKPPALFDQGDIQRLGYIGIDLKSPDCGSKR